MTIELGDHWGTIDHWVGWLLVGLVATKLSDGNPPAVKTWPLSGRICSASVSLMLCSLCVSLWGRKLFGLGVEPGWVTGLQWPGCIWCRYLPVFLVMSAELWLSVWSDFPVYLPQHFWMAALSSCSSTCTAACHHQPVIHGKSACLSSMVRRPASHSW